MRKLAFLAAALAIAGCALTAGMQESVVAGFCGVQRGQAWALTDAPADADAYRRLAAVDDRGSRFAEREFWFADVAGDVRYCRTSLRRGQSLAERNGSGCDDRLGRWWDFQRTEAGLVTEGQQERICVL